MPGSYPPFTVNRAGLTITAEPGATATGTPTARDIVLINASNVTLTGLTVQGCIPNPAPVGGIDTAGSAGVRVGPGTSGVTLDHLTVANSHGTNTDGLPFGCFGIELQNSTHDTISNSDIHHNGEGIAIIGAGTGTLLKNNTIHDNDVIMKNTVASTSDDWGGVGISFSSADGVTATGNSIYNNAGPSHDYTTDGGAFEIWQSNNITMTANTIANNVDILETGAGGTSDCTGNSFTNNTATGRTPGSTLTIATGLILRCAKNMTVSDNTFTNLDWWTMWIYQRQADGYNGGSVAGLTVTRNIITQSADQVYDLGAIPATSTLGIDNNYYLYQGAFGTLTSGLQVRTLAAWQSATGYDSITLP
jgi:parallel beta-helix repeat protein